MRLVYNLVLASSSNVRSELLKKMNLSNFQVYAPNVDESILHAELPSSYSTRVAMAKCNASIPCNPDSLILSADTAAVCGRRIMGKPLDRDMALRCIELLSGRRHRVYTTVCLYVPGVGVRSKQVITFVKFKRLSVVEKKHYIDSDLWQNVAGGYAINGYAGVFVEWIRGSHSAVMGLPLAETYKMLLPYLKHT